MLSRLRWLMAMAIGTVIIAAVWFSPKRETQSGTRAPYQQATQADASAAAHVPAEADWDSRLTLYRTARDVLVSRTQHGPTREAALASLRRQYFQPDEVPRVEALDQDEQAKPPPLPQTEEAGQNFTK